MGKYTMIAIEDNVTIEIGRDIAEVEKSVKEFFSNKIIGRGTYNKNLGVYNGISQLSSKLVQFLENNEDDEKYPSTVWLHDKEQEIGECDYIRISIGDKISLNDKDVREDIAYIIKNSNKININGVPNIIDVLEFKKIFSDRFLGEYHV